MPARALYSAAIGCGLGQKQAMERSSPLHNESQPHPHRLSEPPRFSTPAPCSQPSFQGQIRSSQPPPVPNTFHALSELTCKIDLADHPAWGFTSPGWHLLEGIGAAPLEEDYYSNSPASGSCHVTGPDQNQRPLQGKRSVSHSPAS